MKRGASYPKVVQWSEEDQTYVGSCPGLFYGGCHGSDEKKVFAALCRLVDETIDLYRKEGKALPPPMLASPIKNRKRRIA
jgi:predicted RNase H-like HicB family nuclease